MPIRYFRRRAVFRLVPSCVVAALLVVSASADATAPSFTLFESGQVRPLALSPDGRRLFAVNTPDNRLEVYSVRQGGLVHLSSVPVGLEPVALAARTNDEVWVVNHLSDSVSVVRLGRNGATGHVDRTLLVGDEPRDIVFAGPGRRRGFITAAHRGQNVPFDPQLTTPGVGRADVWVFDAGALGRSLGGDPLAVITLFADTPRALAASPDGSHVYAASFHSGNRTTSVFETMVSDGFGPGGLPPPSTNFEQQPAPEVGIIVKWSGAHWVDTAGRTWDDAVKLSLPDKDVFVIDAMATRPALRPGPAGFFTGVGTVLYNMAVNPVNGAIYVSNTDANNLDRFEGPGTFAGQTVRGHLHESRITVIGANGVTPRHLNPHIDYAACCAATPNQENAASLASPTGMAVSSNGETLYVAALGSSKVGVYRTAALESMTAPTARYQIPVTGGGPTGLVLDEPRQQLYVLTRFDNAISIVSTARRAEVDKVWMFNPEPESVVRGRPFLYDASFSSSHGDSSCASCHVFGDLDSLAWDLGNPDAPVVDHPGPFADDPLVNLITGEPITHPTFHPMKGPMTTQSLRGMANHGPMHWRGDRTGGNDAPSAQPDSGSFDERAAFEKFQGGFTDLLGRHAPIPDADMEAFTDFVLQITYPPNPIRALDNSLTAEQQSGFEAFQSTLDTNGKACIGCHVLDADAGLFGTAGLSNFALETQLFKVPQLRNAYQKVGKFGFPAAFGFIPGDNGFTGAQVRGFGFIHDGSVDTIFRFLHALGFSTQFPPGEIPDPPEGEVTRRNLEAFVLAFDSNLAPIVGQQVTLTQTNAAVAGPRIDLLMSRADTGECDLVVKGQIAGRAVSYLYVGADELMADRQASPTMSGAALRARVTGAAARLTYTCAPPGSGDRIAIDRDADGFLDGDEEDACSDPADPASTP
ncbi:hypothetical protein WME75_25750 [Sorangium sp. So ce1014]|uniref:YncE family protein n=1 Tax=Sorangium sp. So ce1014 TaxID=3133326 RepID=UPI003F61090F